MFFAIAYYIIVKGTTLEPGMRVSITSNFGARVGTAGIGLTSGDTLLFISRLDLTTVIMSTFCCFASFLA